MSFPKLSSVIFKISRPGAIIVASAILLSGLSSCSTHRSNKRTEYYRTHHKQRDKGKKKKTGGEFSGNHTFKFETHGNKIAEEALTWIGTPYKFAGQEKGVGTDCSGMVMVIYEQIHGHKMPRNSAKQAEHCKEIEHHKVQSGDLVFFATGGDLTSVSHVGIMLDNMNFVHASSSKGVIISNLETEYYSNRLVMFGRVPVK